ncbi:MAG: mannose-6-phosphate isomerase, partial [Prochloraceae cyanobacterium]
MSLPASVSPSGVAATEIRPWGSFTTLEEGPGYKIKRIEVNPGHRLSLQMHHHRSEH